MLPWPKRNTAQESVPFESIYDDGICDLGNHKFSATWAFDDTNYSNTEDSSKVVTFGHYCQFLNSFDETAQLQVSVLTKPLSRSRIRLDVTAPDSAVPDLKQCVSGYNDFMHCRFISDNTY
ncbi:hypothetical protein EQM14_02780 [Caproiciproducens sp. NJN-50]|uniref:hypothetical protein n=1 Tax=Caproiciproducens sp. NJN-50 TaxID=2507162 RepID=UPI000FFE06EB|nr:hypothetical protein [Caproiciproducens sp. NJN-50]QAT48779.1 hypothetical protein EQM14_02780 [Caproiciproducens sp. NJN-50]